MKERKRVRYRTCQENEYNKKSGTYKEINIVGTKSKIMSLYILHALKYSLQK